MKYIFIAIFFTACFSFLNDLAKTIEMKDNYSSQKSNLKSNKVTMKPTPTLKQVAKNLQSKR